MMPIAHRGLWMPNRTEENTLTAIAAATSAGYGLELDVRLHDNGRLILQHERGDAGWCELQSGAWTPGHTVLLDALRAAPVILWDIKEICAMPRLLDWLSKHDLKTGVLFDMEIADKSGEYVVNTIPSAVSYLCRASERESLFDALSNPVAAGVWLDAWECEWVDAATIATVQAAGKRAYVCSSELHQRPINLRLWREWAGADGIVTDYPHLLAGLDRPELQPAGWHAEAR